MQYRQSMSQQAPAPEDRIDELYWFSKNKIGRHLAYPLKRSLLDTALRSASVL